MEDGPLQHTDERPPAWTQRRWSREAGVRPETQKTSSRTRAIAMHCNMLVLEPRSHSSASTLTPDWLYFARYFSLFILPSYSLNGPSLISFSNAAKSHIFRKASAGPMTGGSSEVEGGCWECVCRIREPVSALDHTGKYSHGTSCCHAKMSRVNIGHIVPVVEWSPVVTIH